MAYLNRKGSADPHQSASASKGVTTTSSKTDVTVEGVSRFPPFSFWLIPRALSILLCVLKGHCKMKGRSQ